MATHLLLEDRLGTLTSKQTELVIAARDDAEKLNAIIERLLDIGRIESGRALMEPKAIDPEKLVNDAVADFSTAYRNRGVTLLTDVEPDLPEALADLSRIGHVFSNLLDNALKYTPSGGIVTISARHDSEFILFSVKDTGRGIPKESLPKIFERFYRVPDQENIKGAGLGLAIAREIVEAHGGTIGVTSEPGKGSIFTFSLKIAKSEVPNKERKKHG
jgi:signal transduction histidine kinase